MKKKSIDPATRKLLKTSGYQYKTPSFGERLVAPKKIQTRVLSRNQGMQKTIDSVRKKGYPGANFIK